MSAVVLGSDVDALVTAHMLAARGEDVTLVGERAQAHVDRLEAGCVPPHVVRALELEGRGLRIHVADPWAVVPLPDGGRLELRRDIAACAESIRRVSPRDAQRWPAFCERMHALAQALEALYVAPPPDPLADTWKGMAQVARTGFRLRALGNDGMADFLRLLPMPAADWLDEWFENDAVKVALGGLAIRNLCQGPRSGGTAFNLLHHHVGSAPGVFRPPRTNVRAALARRAGIAVREERVARIEVRDGAAAGVTLETSETMSCEILASALSPRQTLLELAGADFLDPSLVHALMNIRSRGVIARVSLTLEADPGFTTLVLARSLDDLERAYDDTKYGAISRAPYVEASYLGAGPDGRHEVEVHIQYVPYAPAGVTWDGAQAENLTRAALAHLTEHVPGFADTVIGARTMTPDDLSHLHGYPQGQPYHAELALDQVLWMRPIPQLAQYRTPIHGLYLCGPAMHPGGGIAGAAGANAASVILADRRKR